MAGLPPSREKGEHVFSSIFSQHLLTAYSLCSCSWSNHFSTTFLRIVAGEQNRSFHLRNACAPLRLPKMYGPLRSWKRWKSRETFARIKQDKTKTKQYPLAYLLLTGRKVANSWIIRRDCIILLVTLSRVSRAKIVEHVRRKYFVPEFARRV